MASPNENNKKSITVYWSIENLAHCVQKIGKNLNSPDFPVGELLFYLSLVPRSRKNEKYMSLYLDRSKFCAGPEYASLSYELSLMCEGQTLFCRKCENDFEKDYGWGATTTVQRVLVTPKNEKRCFEHKIVTILCRIWKKDGDFSTSGRCSLQTIIGVNRFSFPWKIDQFTELHLGEKKSWCIQLGAVENDPRNAFFSCITLEFYGYKLKLHIKFVPKKLIFATCKMQVVDADGIVIKTQEDEHWVEPVIGESIWRFPSFLDLKQLLRNKDLYLPSGTLTLQCHLALSEGVVFENAEEVSGNCECLKYSFSENQPSYRELRSPPKVTEMVSTSIPTLNSDLSYLHNESSMCDKKLRTRNSILPAHSFILSARSPVFRKILKSGTKAKSSDQVDILDLDDDTARRMLLFLYTDRVEEDWSVDTAKKLFYAADKYEIELLKCACLSYLADNMSIDNVCEILTFAESHRDMKLRKAATEYVLDNYKKVMRSEQWAAFMKDSHQIAANIIQLHCLR